MSSVIHNAGGIGEIAKRAGMAFATGGYSEYGLAAKKALTGDYKGAGTGLALGGAGYGAGAAGTAAIAPNKGVAMPDPPAAVSTPTTDSPAVQLAGAAAAQKAASRRGFRSTILSSMASQVPSLRTTLGS